MRNLKRALSLALASVMLLGMMVIGASASYSDFTDQDEIVNKEAVALLTDLGVINGTTPTTYNPTGTIERAALSKMIYFVMMGDADATPYEGMGIFSDVAGSWAEGYINYCASVGIFGGVGGDRFSPYSTLTVAQAAKGLLVALGYVAEDRGYNGNNWTVGVIRDAQSNGLLNGITQGVNEAITRDNAAQMIFNALNAEMVEPQYQYDMGNQYVTGYTRLGQTLGQVKFSLVKVTATVTGISNGMATLSATAVNDTAGLSVSGVAISNVLPATPDMLNTSVNLYAQGTLTVNASGTVTGANLTKIYSTALTEAGSNTVYTLYGQFGSTAAGDATLTALLDTAATKVASLESGKTIEDLKYFYNGTNLTDKSSPNNAGVDTEDEAQALVGKNGVIVELKDTDTTAGVDTVMITAKSVATLSAAPVITTAANGTQTVTITAMGLNKNVELVRGYEGLAKGDVVLYVEVGGVTYIEKATSVSGTVTAQNNLNAIRVNGTYYGLSDLTGASYATSKTWSDFRNTYTFYLDNGNNVVKAVAQTTATTASYAVLLNTGWAGSSTEIGASSYGQAQLLLADGTTTVVQMSSVDGKTVVASGATGNQVNYNDASITKGVFYTYTVGSNGAYSLTKVNSSAVNIAGTTISNVPQFDGSTVGNAATVFLVKNGNSYTAYTGIANVPAMSALTATKSDIVTVNNVAAYVYVDATGATVNGEVGEYIYIPNKNKYNNYPAVPGGAAAHIEVNGIVNGQTVALSFAAGNGITIGGTGSQSFSNVAVKTLYEVVAKDANGVITSIKPVATVNGINVAAGGVLSVGSTPDVYTYDSSTVVYYFDENGNCSVMDGSGLAVDATDKVSVVAGADKYATAVYVQQVVKTEATATEIKYSVDGGEATATTSTSGTVNVTPASGSAGKTVAITSVTVAPGATYTVSGTAVVQTNGTAATDANTIVITVIAEDGVTSSQITLTFVAAA